MPFPLPFIPQLSYTTGGRRFGADRSGGRKHAGCDLIAPLGTPVFAVERVDVRGAPRALDREVTGATRGLVGQSLVTIDTESWTGNLKDPELKAEIQKAIDDANSQVSQAESIRKFKIMPEDWTEENGYLTPSFKVKRTAVLRDFHDTVEALFTR